MSYYRTLCYSNPFMLNGVVRSDVSLSMPRPASLYADSAFGAEYLKGPTLAEMRASLFAKEDEVLIDKIWQLTECGDGLLMLGPGHICPYCGDYNPAGSLLCRRCRGLTKQQDFIKPEKLPFVLAYWNVNPVVESYVEIDLDFVATAPVTTLHLAAMLGRDPITGDTRPHNLLTLPNGCTFPTGYYVCQYCGATVDEDKTCPRCGGVRALLSEVVKMDNKCIYCGSTVVGGVVCPGCQGTIATTALRGLA